jgi:hypothetical protein
MIIEEFNIKLPKKNNEKMVAKPAIIHRKGKAKRQYY